MAVGILVDHATVEIENIERNLAMGNEYEAGDSRARSRSPCRHCVDASASALCSCHVFSGGVAKFLFVPLAEAVSSSDVGELWLSPDSISRRW